MLKVLALFFACLWTLSPCAAQEVEGRGKSGSPVFLPADYLELTTPLTNRIAVNTYGFYLGNIRGSIALLEIPLAVQKHFMLIDGQVAPSRKSSDPPPYDRNTVEVPAASTIENSIRGHD
jgi:hypothetical protein